MKKKAKKGVSSKPSEKASNNNPSKINFKKNPDDDFSIIQFIVGVSLCLYASILMYFNSMSLPMRLSIGIVGIILIATSPFGPFKYAKD